MKPNIVQNRGSSIEVTPNGVTIKIAGITIGIPNRHIQGKDLLEEVMESSRRWNMDPEEREEYDDGIEWFKSLLRDNREALEVMLLHCV